MGPFECSEMALEDIALSSVTFTRPPGWPVGWYTVLASYVA